MTTRTRASERIRGLYGIADGDACDDPIALAADLLAGGCRVVQLRCKRASLDELERLALDVAMQCRRVGATFLVNDHPEVAVAVDADGVHVGQTDGDTAWVRSVVGDHRIVGRSTNHPAQVPAALAGADYIAFGPIFATGNVSRPKEVQGLDALRRVRTVVPRGVPLVAIGGIDALRLPGVIDAGADAWAVIGAIAGSVDRVAATRAFVERG